MCTRMREQRDELSLRGLATVDGSKRAKLLRGEMIVVVIARLQGAGGLFKIEFIYSLCYFLH